MKKTMKKWSLKRLKILKGGKSTSQSFVKNSTFLGATPVFVGTKSGVGLKSGLKKIEF